jgi:hypothetical protein
MRTLLCGEDGAAESRAGAVFPLVAHRIFRRHRQRAREGVAGGGFAGAAEFSGGGTEPDVAETIGIIGIFVAGHDLVHPLPQQRQTGVPNTTALPGIAEMLS